MESLIKLLRKPFVILFVACISSCLSPVWAANNIETHTHTIEISSIDSPWASSTDTTNLTTDQRNYGLYVHSIYFKPGATDDECIIYSGNSTSGVLIFPPLSADAYDERIKYYPPDVRRHLYLDFTNGTYSSGSMVIIELWKE